MNMSDEILVPFEHLFGKISDLTLNEQSCREQRLPKGYIGKNEHLASFWLNKIFEAPAFATSTLLPMAMASEQVGALLSKFGIVWDEFKFNHQLVGPMPTEDVSYLVSQLCSESKDHMVRFGLCFVVNHGFATSLDGLLSYQLQLDSIRDATLQALHIDVITALLACDDGDEASLSLKQRADLDCERFAEVQKNKNGWKALDWRARTSLGSHNVSPNTWVLDDLVGDVGGTSVDVTFFRVEPIHMPGFDDPVNILSRKRTIGEYTTSFAHLVGSETVRYESSSRDIMIYDAAKACLSKVELSDGLAHCMRFDDAGELTAHGFTPGPEFDGSDMFFTPEHPNGVRFFFDLDEVAMPQQAIKDWTASVVAQFEPVVLAELRQDLKALEDLVNKLESAPHHEDNGDDVLRYFSFICDRTNHPVVGGVPLLDTLFDKMSPRCSRNLIPYGYGSYEGICRLAEFSDKQLEISYQAKRAKRAVETLCVKLDEVNFGNLFTGIGGTSEEATFNNLLSSKDAPLVIDGKRTWLACSKDLKAYLDNSTTTTGRVLTMGTKPNLSFSALGPPCDGRLAHWCNASSLERIIGTAFLGNAVHGKTLRRFLDGGCVFPFNLIYARPYQAYNMSAGICMQSGKSTGETFVRSEAAHVMLNDDLVNRTHTGCFSIETKPVVYEKQNVFVARDMFCSEYCGGAGTKFFGSQKEHNHQLNPPAPSWSVPSPTAALGDEKSLFAMLVPYALYEPEADTASMDLSSSTLLTYASSNFYRTLWGWSAKSTNTVCFQGLQNMYNPATKLYDIVVHNQGHWCGSKVST